VLGVVRDDFEIGSRRLIGFSPSQSRRVPIGDPPLRLCGHFARNAERL
jgi:hypothetical protein